MVVHASNATHRRKNSIPLSYHVLHTTTHRTTIAPLLPLTSPSPPVPPAPPTHRVISLRWMGSDGSRNQRPAMAQEG